MANTVYHYAPTTWTNGVTAANATNMSHLETGPLDALSGLNPDLFTAFVLSGITCTKDGVTANQLDIASGRAYVTQTDGTLALIVVGADNTHTTSALSSTYYLYLQPDGTWFWSTTNSGFQTNSLFIAQVTTDASGNILAVTDERTTFTALLSGMGGHLNVPKIGAVNGQATAGGFGVPMVVAQALNVHVTNTGSNTILSYTPTATGLYRVSGSFQLNNGTSGQFLSISLNFTDPNNSAGQFLFLSGAASATAYVFGNMAVTVPNNFVSLDSISCYALANQPIVVSYRDFGGTPNDFISLVLERIA